MPEPLDNNRMFHIPIDVVNQENFKVSVDQVTIRRNAEVGEIMKPLELRYPGSYITLNNQLSHLQEDDTVEDVYEEGDVLTAVKLRPDVCRNFGSGIRVERSKSDISQL